MPVGMNFTYRPLPKVVGEIHPRLEFATVRVQGPRVNEAFGCISLGVGHRLRVRPLQGRHCCIA